MSVPSIGTPMISILSRRVTSASPWLFATKIYEPNESVASVPRSSTLTNETTHRQGTDVLETNKTELNGFFPLCLRLRENNLLCRLERLGVVEPKG
jgi:hypothetical protein